MSATTRNSMLAINGDEDQLLSSLTSRRIHTYLLLPLQCNTCYSVLPALLDSGASTVQNRGLISRLSRHHLRNQKAAASLRSCAGRSCAGWSRHDSLPPGGRWPTPVASPSRWAWHPNPASQRVAAPLCSAAHWPVSGHTSHRSYRPANTPFTNLLFLTLKTVYLFILF